MFFRTTDKQHYCMACNQQHSEVMATNQGKFSTCRTCIIIVGRVHNVQYYTVQCMKLCSQLARGRDMLAVHACPSARAQAFTESSNSARI